jgi:hypothetical protein
MNIVLGRRSSLTEKYREEKLTPLICLSGLYLKGYGFEVGRRFEVCVQKVQLALKAKKFKDQNPIIKKRR